MRDYRRGSVACVPGRLIRDAGLKGVVTLRGAQPMHEVYTSMMGTDVLVLRSEVDLDGFRDALPTVILEAMAQSLAVVSTWVSGIPEMVEHGATGFLVSERDPEEAASSIAVLLKDADLRRSMGAVGKRKLDDKSIPKRSPIFESDCSMDRLCGRRAS